MRIVYYPEADSMYIDLSAKESVESTEISPGVARPNPIGPWELRIGRYRIFYEIIESQRVKVLAIGHKEHNKLFIQGKKVEI